MKNLKFYLLGKCDQGNPSSIPLDQIKSWENEGLITYLGEHSDVRPIIEKSSCIILPSYREGIPRSLLEAMSMKKPIITTNVSGCRECIKNPINQDGLPIGENGILVEPKDSQSLAQAILYLSNLPTQSLKIMGENGRDYVKERFEISNTIQTYQQAVSKNPTSQTLAFISNTSFGMHNFRLPILKALQKEGHTIHIIAPTDSSTQALKKEGFIHHHISVNSKGLNPFEDFALMLKIKTILAQIKPTLVFNYTIKPAIYGSMICNLLKIPNIAVITGLGYVFIDNGIKKKILRQFVCSLYRIALKKTQEVWFLNNEDREVFLKHQISQNTQSKILDSEGIDTNFFAPSIENENYPVSQDIHIVLIARMLWDKGVGEFIDAIRIIKSKDPN